MKRSVARDPQRTDAADIRLDQLGRTLRFSIFERYRPERQAPGSIAEKENSSAIGRPLRQEVVGWMLYTSYLIPFEIASMLLLVAMIGAIVLAKREL